MSNKLWLSIESEPYEVECDECDGSGVWQCPDKILGIKMSFLREDCGTCGKTGKRTVRLQTKPGKLIEIKWDHAVSRAGNEIPVLAAQTHLGLPNIDPDEIESEIVEAYKAGTLPDHIRDCLEEVPVS